MGYRVRPSSHGGDRRHGRSLTETLLAGNNRYGEESWDGPMEPYTTEDETYDEAVGPPDLTRRQGPSMVPTPQPSRPGYGEVEYQLEQERQKKKSK